VPGGRDIPAVIADSYCTADCTGYLDEPRPGSLWPGETDEDYGFPCGTNATREMTSAEIALNDVEWLLDNRVEHSASCDALVIGGPDCKCDLNRRIRRIREMMNSIPPVSR